MLLATRDELVLPNTAPKVGESQLAPLTICPKSMAVVPARPALRADPSTTAMIGHDPKCLMVCWV